MAKTYDILTSQAETIRTNTLPNSNTAGLVGQMLKDIIEKVSEVNTSSSGAVTAINVSTTADAFRPGGREGESAICELAGCQRFCCWCHHSCADVLNNELAQYNVAVYS